MNPQVSIVIVSYQVKDLLRTCLNSIYTFSTLSFEIIVVDNNSSDGTIEMLKLEFSSVKLIANSKNIGFSAANNQGISLSKGRFIFLLNPDTEFGNNVLLELMKQENPTLILAPQLVNTDGSLQTSCWKFPSVWDVMLESLCLHLLFNNKSYRKQEFENDFYPDWASGAALFFEQSLAIESDGLDEKLFWMEDVDFCYRASKNGIKIAYIPEARVFHHIGKSASKNPSIAIANQLLSKAKYFKKHQGYFVFSLAMLFIFIQIITRIVAFGMLSFINKNNKLKFTAYLFSLMKYYRYLFRNDSSLI